MILRHASFTKLTLGRQASYCNLSQLKTSCLKVIFAYDTVFKTSKLPIDYRLYSIDITMFLVGQSTMKCRNYLIKMSPRVTRVGSIRKDEIETVLENSLDLH